MKTSNYKNLITERVPTVYMTFELKEQIMALVNSTDANECQWFHCISKGRTKSGQLYYVLDQILIPEQEVSAAAVESPGKGMMSLYQELKTIHKKADGTPDMAAIQAILSTMHAWCHSHVNMGVTPSSTDNTTFSDWIKANKDDGCKSPVMMIIVNKREEIYIRLYDEEEDILCENPPLEIWMPSVDTSDIVRQAKAKIKQRTFQYSSVGWAGYSNGMANHRLLGAHDDQKKKNQRTTTNRGLAASLRSMINTGSERLKVDQVLTDALVKIQKSSAVEEAEAALVVDRCLKAFPEPLDQYILLSLLKATKKELIGAIMLASPPIPTEEVQAELFKYLESYWIDQPNCLYAAAGATVNISKIKTIDFSSLTRLIDFYLDCIEIAIKDESPNEGVSP